LGNCTVRITFVRLEPAGRTCGVIVAVAPGGKPLTERVTGAGKVVIPTGARLRLYVAVPPGATVVVVEPDPEPEPEEKFKLKSFTCSLTAALVAVRKFESPEYTAVIE
jgi:hypothetical protein